MIFVYEKNDVTYARNLNSITTFSVLQNIISDYSSGNSFLEYDTSEEALSRFNDIVNAAATDLNVYDSRKEVGYWKAKKPGPKPKAKAPAPETPQPTK